MLLWFAFVVAMCGFPGWAAEIEPALVNAEKSLVAAAAEVEQEAARNRLVQPVERPATVLL